MSLTAYSLKELNKQRLLRIKEDKKNILYQWVFFSDNRKI